MSTRSELLPALSDYRWLRWFAFAALYVAQGLPYGLFIVAIPTWLAHIGTPLATVASFMGIVGLPWSFKFVVAPLMDRVRFPAMGSRRPWVILAQLGIVLPWLFMAFSHGNASIGLLTALGFLLNLFGAAQDVAVDGMAIEVLPEDERATANSLMFAGQVLGMSAASAGGGAALKYYGIPAAAWMMAGTTFLIFLVPLLLRERPGERLLPWSTGEAAPSRATGEHRNVSLWQLTIQLVRALILPTSLLILMGQFLDRVAGGMFGGLMPSLSINALHWDQTTYPNWYATAGVIAALFGVAVAPSIARAGTDRSFAMAVLCKVILFAAIALTSSLWRVPGFMPSMIVMVNCLGQLSSIAVVALCMSACSPRIAATQFSIYMATANLANSGGAALAGLLARFGCSFPMMFAVAAVLYAVVLLFWRRVDIVTHRAQLEPAL